MPVTVNINNLSLCHLGSNGVSMATIPDVCNTPTPAGPVPIPYPNIALSSNLAQGTTTITADGGNMCANYGSEFATSTGDEPGTVGGIISATFMMEATWITYSFDVKLEGKGACRLTDKMFHNHQNTVNMAGEIQPPLTALKLLDKCMQCDAAVAVYEKAAKANGGTPPSVVMGPSIIRSGGHTDTVRGIITIDEVKIDPVKKQWYNVDPCLQLETLCFEFGNLSHKADFDAAFNSAPALSRADFIRKCETIEYKNALDTYKIFQACKDKWGCSKSQFEWVTGFKNFDEYFKSLDTTHQEVYGKYWDQVHASK